MAQGTIPAHPFADLLGITVSAARPGFATARATVDSKRHFNPNGVAHGGVAYALADTAMGAALMSSLGPEQFCATIEVKISYFAPVQAGELVCEAEVINRGKRVANVDARLYLGDALVGHANGNFAILAPRNP